MNWEMGSTILNVMVVPGVAAFSFPATGKDHARRGSFYALAGCHGRDVHRLSSWGAGVWIV